MDQVMDFAVQLANQAGSLLLDYYRYPNLQTSLKADHSLVTEADLAADRFITQAIHERFPQDDLISEEGNTTATLNSTYLTAQPVWIIDPLDGTTNFSLGLPVWGILLARLVDGWPELAVANFPLLNECYTARLGQGAWLNEQLIQVDPRGSERSQSFFACCSRTFRRYNVNLHYKIRILGSAGYTFCLLARGSALIGFEVTPKIWDISGPWLIVTEAGGLIDTLDGSNRPLPVLPGKSYAKESFPTLAAASLELLIKARQSILRKTA